MHEVSLRISFLPLGVERGYVSTSPGLDLPRSWGVTNLTLRVSAPFLFIPAGRSFLSCPRHSRLFSHYLGLHLPVGVFSFEERTFNDMIERSETKGGIDSWARADKFVAVRREARCVVILGSRFLRNQERFSGSRCWMGSRTSGAQIASTPNRVCVAARGLHAPSCELHITPPTHLSVQSSGHPHLEHHLGCASGHLVSQLHISLELTPFRHPIPSPACLRHSADGDGLPLRSQERQ
ncbi:hypothetical protein R3P38DRAFT_2958205 [Favolaschia claudopus]|uniref:Uncharacterized protein n=1 Tax=Favolaschia claudopus TaxID=2862362 RepID=A0AAW0BB90_9AGAR